MAREGGCWARGFSWSFLYLSKQNDTQACFRNWVNGAGLAQDGSGRYPLAKLAAYAKLYGDNLFLRVV